MQISQGRRMNPKLCCEQLIFIVRLLKQRTTMHRVSSTRKPGSFYIFNPFSVFVSASLFLKSILADCSGFSTMYLLGSPSPYSHVLQLLTGLFLKKSNKILSINLTEASSFSTFLSRFPVGLG